MAVMFALNRVKVSTFGGLSRVFRNLCSVPFDEKPIPQCPKKPINPFICFLREKREQTFGKNSPTKLVEQVKILAKQWKELDPTEKKKYSDMYQKNFNEYIKAYKIYTNLLTEEQQIAIEENKMKKLKLDKARKLKQTLKKLGKPHRPRNAYIIWVAENFSKNVSGKHPVSDRHEVNQSNVFTLIRDSLRRVVDRSRDHHVKVPLKETAKRLGVEWKNLPEEIKQVYQKKAVEERERYAKEMLEWKTRMVEEDRHEIVEYLSRLKIKEDS